MGQGAPQGVIIMYGLGLGASATVVLFVLMIVILPMIFTEK